MEESDEVVVTTQRTEHTKRFLSPENEFRILPVQATHLVDDIANPCTSHKYLRCS